MTIRGPGAGLTVSGGGAGRVFVIDSGTTAAISGLTITGGSSSTDGGGVYNQGTATLSDCTLSANTANNNGGGVGGDGTTALYDCTISGNSAAGGGGLVVGGAAILTDCTISGNSAGTGGGLYDKGTATLQGAIVAGNTGTGGSASDIHGSVAGSSSYDLIGTGGSGGLTNGAGHNIVLATLAGLGLAPLGSYGGPTATMALLPGSVAIGAGTAEGGITTDQRGASRSTSGPGDIGAFQDQGYTVAVSSGSGQSALVGQAFNSPLTAEVTEAFSSAPLPGVTISFSAPSSGASAALSSNSTVTNASGLASITATANATPGTYAVTASATGVNSSASFSLANQIQPSFEGLTSQTIVYGSTVTLTGTLAAGSQAPAGEDVVLTIGDVTHDAEIASDGSFSTQFSRADVILNASSAAYNITYHYAGDGAFLEADGSSQLTVNPAALTIAAVANTKKYDGTTNATAAPTITSGSLAPGDTADFTEAYGTKNAGVGLTLSPSGTVADGNGGRNYTYTFVAVTTGVIAPAVLRISATSDTKVYDGTTTSSKAPTYTGLVVGDSLTALVQAFASKDVLGTNGSTLTVTGYTVNDGDGGQDYKVITQNAPGTITPAALTITAVSDARVYDGTTVSSKTPTAGTLYGGDTVTGLIQAFQSKDVLEAGGSTLVVTGYTVNDGDGGQDYMVTTRTATGTITPAALTITAASDIKVYDGTAVSSQAPTLGMLYAGDTVTGLAQAFASKDVLGANGSTLIVTDYIVDDGDSGKDYTVTTRDALGTITPAALTITADDQTKVYSALIPTLTASYDGFVPGDTATSLATPPSLSTAATASSPDGSYSITASGAADPNYTITYVPGTLTVVPLEPAKLVINTEPPATATAGQPFASVAQPVIVYEEDSYGNLETTDNSTVVTVSSLGVGSGPLVGTLTAQVVGGVATFSDLADNTVETITLSFSGGGLTPATSSPIFVARPAGAKLIVAQQPSPVAMAGQVFATQPIVEEVDQYGDVIADSTGTVSAALGDTGTATLLGNDLTVTLVDGAATFAGLSYDKAEPMDITFTSSVAGVAPVTSNPVSVKPGLPNQLVIAQRPSATATAGQPFDSQPVIYEEDAFNNVESSDSTSPVTAMLASGSGPLRGLPSVTLVNGVGRFSGLSDNTAETITLQFSSGSLLSAPSSPIVVGPAAAVKLVVTTPPPDPITAGQAFTVVVSVEDPYGNVDTSYNGNMAITLPGQAGSPVTVQAQDGVAAFTGLTVDTTAQGGSIQVSEGGPNTPAGGGLTISTPPITVLPAITMNPPPPSPPTITGEQVVMLRKTNKKGKPVGKAVLQGFTLDFSTTMNSTTAGYSANYVVAAASTRRGKKKGGTTLNRVALTASYNAATNSVTLTLAGKQTFAKGGEITVVYSPPDGVSSASGVALDPDDAAFTIQPGAKGITPG